MHDKHYVYILNFKAENMLNINTIQLNLLITPIL